MATKTTWGRREPLSPMTRLRARAQQRLKIQYHITNKRRNTYYILTKWINETCYEPFVIKYIKEYHIRQKKTHVVIKLGLYVFLLWQLLLTWYFKKISNSLHALLLE